MSSSNHQSKRPYAGSQPSITSYFSPAVSPTSTVPPPNYSIAQQTSYSESRTPQLPATVQSNLLSVGMRVRKSVPEGYKTGSYSAFTLFSDSAPTTPVEQQRVEDRMSGNGKIANRPRARELTPFCGLLKIGGLAQQQWGIYSPGAQTPDDEMDDGNYMPTLSQGSTASNDSVSTPGERKRRMDFDEEDREESQFEFSFNPRASLSDRAIAVPRRRKYQMKTNVAVVGQENMETDMDFAEADFLDYGLLGEVEMGGV